MSQVTKQSRNPGSARVKTNLFAKDMRVISDKYRRGWERIFSSNGEENKKINGRNRRKG